MELENLETWDSLFLSSYVFNLWAIPGGTKSLLLVLSLEITLGGPGIEPGSSMCKTCCTAAPVPRIMELKRKFQVHNKLDWTIIGKFDLQIRTEVTHWFLGAILYTLQSYPRSCKLQKSWKIYLFFCLLMYPWLVFQNQVSQRDYMAVILLAVNTCKQIVLPIILLTPYLLC